MITRNPFAALQVAVLALLCGCTTTYVGQKMDVSGKLPKAGSGVPFTMSKPQYKLNIAADPNEPTREVYTLVAEDVPDATLKFTIALDPALWVDGKFDLDIGDTGNLAGATSTTNSRIVDTFSALVSLGLKLKSTGVLDAVGTVALYKSEVAKSTAAACIAASGNSRMTVGKAIETEITHLEAEAKAEIGEAKNFNAAVAELVGARLHYLDSQQRQCMEEVLVQFDGAVQKQNFDNSIGAAKAAATSESDKTAVEAMLKSIQGFVAALDEANLKLLADELRGKMSPYTLVRAATATGSQLIDAVRAGRFARSLPNMSAEVWRSRHLAYLERKLTAIKLDLLLSKPPQGAVVKAPGDEAAKATAKALATKAALEAEWAATLGEAPTVQRIARIDTFLLTSKDLDPGQRTRRNGATEQVALREERDKLQAQVSKARGDLLGKNKVVAFSFEKAAATKVEPRVNVPVVLASQADVDAANARKVTEKDPEFVLVLSEDTSGAIKGVKP